MRQPFPNNPETEESSLGRYRLAIAFVLVVVLGTGAWAVYFLFSSPTTKTNVDQITLVSLPEPTPPRLTPPPEKLTPPPPEPEKMIAQEPVNEPESKPEDQKPPEAPPALGTGIQGNGAPDGFGLSGNGGNWVGQGGAGRGKATRWGWYAGQVQTRIAELLRSHHQTRSAKFDGLEVKIWPDSTGRILRANLANSTGIASLDDTIKNEVLAGAQLAEAPPKDMPLPIVLRLKALRPN